MMKITFATLATIAAFSVHASSSYQPPTGAINGSATSSVGGSVGSSSVIFGIGQMSSHSAQATAQNCTTITGISQPGTNGATAVTTAATNGSTFVQGAGVGKGVANASATQFGTGNIVSQAGASSRNVVGSAEASSIVTIGTGASISTLDTGKARAGADALAHNESSAMVGSNPVNGGVSVRTDGSSTGYDQTKSYGGASFGAIANAGGTLVMNNGKVSNVGSFQAGVFNASITRNATNTVTGNSDGPTGCVSSSGTTCKE